MRRGKGDVRQVFRRRIRNDGAVGESQHFIHTRARRNNHVKRARRDLHSARQSNVPECAAQHVCRCIDGTRHAGIRATAGEQSMGELQGRLVGCVQ